MAALPQPLGSQPWVITPMREADLDAVMEIERTSFRAPWSRQVFAEELSRHFAFIDVLRWVDSGKVLAYCNYWRVADEVHILKVATHPDARQMGCASRLLEHILAFARRQPCRLVTLEVRRSNEPAQRIYRRFSFKAVGLRPNYYADDNEDAVVMLLDLG
jgi:[ribosomal protein S18]-alanine N-acetyltransferase